MASRAAARVLHAATLRNTPPPNPRARAATAARVPPNLQVFESVEREFEGLYNKYLKQSTYKDTEHRAMLMLLLSIATYRVLNDEHRVCA
eukprot:364323-Chlamydomonas_euryale.AAC.11